MKRIIYINMLLLTVAAVLITTAIFAGMFYHFFNSQMKSEVIKEAQSFANLVSVATNREEYLNSLKLSLNDDRVTLISNDGEVLFDSYSDAAAMENHADRPEIADAKLSGVGESRRFSTTLNRQTYYYAIKLDDYNVLRVAKTTDNLLRVFLPFLLYILAAPVFVILLTYFASKRLTKKIVAPIKNMEPANDDAHTYDELSPFLRTISKQKEQIRDQLETLSERANTTQAIIRDMREGIILLDPSGIILSANVSATTLFNAGVQEYMNRNVLELTRRLDFLEKVRAALAGIPGDLTLEFAARTVQIFFDPVTHNGTTHGAILLFFDITEKSNAEKLRREFTANVSHELKTPLTVIFGLSEMIVLGMAKETDTIGFAQKIKNETERMISLVNDILRLSELDEIPASKQFETFDLYDLAEVTVCELSSFSDEKNIKITIAGDRFEINANKNMVAELFYNLIENAIKYNKENGHVTIALSQTHEKAGSDVCREIKIEVSDTGIGIPAEHLPRIFERFYRVDKSRSKKTGGTGLGLSIVKHIAAHHNGFASVESSPGKGTKITVLLKSSPLK